MRTKTSCFNATALRKDLTRFAPLWGLYTLMLLCGLFLLTGGEFDDSWQLADIIISMSSFMPFVNLAYAFLAAAALFGDLFNSRMCNGLHAMPLRREGWFTVHTLAGLLFSVIPTAVLSLVCLPLLLRSSLDGAWTLSFYFWAYSNLQYLFFFSTAVLAVQCVGNYIAMVLMYLLINGGSVLVYILVDRLLTPMLYGVITPTDAFHFLSPVFFMSGRAFLFDETWEEGLLISFTLGDWRYLLGCAALGVGLLVLACLLYRRRRLETAGDFVALHWLNPVAAVCFALLGCALFHFVYTLTGSTSNYLLAFVGLITGWILGQMFLQRTTRVFQKRTLAGAAVMAAVLGATLLVTRLDPLHIQSSLPDLGKVASARLYGNAYRGDVDASQPEDFAQIQRFHQLALEENLTNAQLDRIFSEAKLDPQMDIERIDSQYLRQVLVSYTMENGSTVRRSYNISANGEAGQLLRQLTSTVANATGYHPDPDWLPDDRIVAKDPAHLMTFVQKPDAINAAGFSVDEAYLTEDTVRRLYEAIIADCQEGTLSPIDSFHPAVYHPNMEYDYIVQNLYLSVEFGEDPETRKELYLHFGADSTHIMSWLSSVGIDLDLKPAYPAT